MKANNKTYEEKGDDKEEIEEEIDYEAKGGFEEDVSDEEDFAITSIIGNQTDDYIFDRFIEQLQEIVIEDEFEHIKNNFFEKHCEIFEDTEENKLVYMDIFKEYIKQLESYIDNNLQKRVKEYKIQDFYRLLKDRKDEIDEQLYEILLSFSDFLIFKDLMLEFKKNKNKQGNMINFGISVQKAVNFKEDDSINFKDYDNIKEFGKFSINNKQLK